MNLNIKKVMFAKKIIDLNTEVSAEKIMVALVFEIDSSGIHMTMILIN